VRSSAGPWRSQVPSGAPSIAGAARKALRATQLLHPPAVMRPGEGAHVSYSALACVFVRRRACVAFTANQKKVVRLYRTRSSSRPLPRA
jgi:hypothetical protein